MCLVFKLVSPKINWTDKTMTNLIVGAVVCIKVNPWVLATAIILGIMTIALICFVLQQAYYISINKTQVELDKYDDVNYEREQRGIKETYKNPYNKGFIQNWKEFIFPPTPELREPRDWTGFGTDKWKQSNKKRVSRGKLDGARMMSK